MIRGYFSLTYPIILLNLFFEGVVDLIQIRKVKNGKQSKLDLFGYNQVSSTSKFPVPRNCEQVKIFEVTTWLAPSQQDMNIGGKFSSLSTQLEFYLTLVNFCRPVEHLQNFRNSGSK